MAHALIVVDMLNDFVQPDGALYVPGAEGIVPAVRRELEAARAAGDLVVYACDRHAPDDREFARFPPHAVADTPGAEVVTELAPAPGEVVVAKTRFSPFFRTNLDSVLAERGIDRATVVGVCTHICVMETVAGLANRDIAVRLPLDAVADFDSEQAAMAIKRMQSLFGAELVEAGA
jgi:nicotinamidase-related amidase